MYFDILTLFPDMFKGPFSESIIARARDKGLIEINLIDFRKYTYDKHNTVDDYPYGGGAGMVLKVEPIYRAYSDVIKSRGKTPPVILLSPQGKRLNQNLVKKYSEEEGVILICGHYEGVDERVRDMIITEEISIGDYVLTGGELPAMVFIEAVSRMITGVLGDENSCKEDSFFNGILDFPQYTRPREFKDREVPEVLLSGHHQKVNKWRRKMALKKTLLQRPDLIDKKELTTSEKELLVAIKKEIERQKNVKN